MLLLFAPGAAVRMAQNAGARCMPSVSLEVQRPVDFDGMIASDDRSI